MNLANRTSWGVRGGPETDAGRFSALRFSRFCRFYGFLIFLPLFIDESF
jgi:hypothetical protein